MEYFKKIIVLILTVFAFVITTPLIAQASPLDFITQRIAGQDRIETAIKISQMGWSSAQTVILCEYSDYPDCIAATPYAVSLNAPILLTDGNTIDPRVLNELQRLKAQKVILLGGTGCLKSSIETELTKLSYQWERIGGANRYETSTLLAKRLTSNSLILANGDDFPDALSAATFAGIKQIPIVLTSTKLPDSVIQYYNEAKPQHLIVIGGEGVIPSSELAKHNFTVETRLGGQDRFDTNAKVVSYMAGTYTSNDIFLASGISFPDAVAGTVLASKDKAPLLLTEPNDIPPSIYSLMRAHMKVEPPSSQPTNTNTSSSSNSSSNTNNNSPQQGVITSPIGLNLRDTSSASGKILCVIPKGTTIQILDSQNNWYKTTYHSFSGWVSSVYVSVSSTTNPSSTSSSTTNSSAIDLSPNGTVYILGGTGVISANAQIIIEGKASSTYPDNLKTFPPLPAKLQQSDTSPNDGNTTTPPTPPVPTKYDPSTEVPVDPFAGIPANALAGKTIVVDPGHGGPDTGAIGPNHTFEKTNTLAIALDLNTILQKAGANVILTRDNDTSPAKGPYSEVADLQARVDIANQAKADLFICIHNDSFTNPDVQGTTTYYASENPKPNESMQLASSIETAVTQTCKTNDRGVKEADYYVLRHTTMPAILIEVAFISNPYEEARLQNPTFRNNVAAAIFQGIYNYYTTPLPSD